MEAPVPSPQTTLLILLGASTWPFSPEFQSSQAFANAARRLKAYFLNPRPFGLPAENLLDLFDSTKGADELDVEIGQFLERRLADMKKVGNPARDLLLYFIGHGGFVGRDSDFYLAIRRTRMDNPRASGLQMMALADSLTEHARYLRRIIILDCCFAAAAFAAFQSGPAQVALEKTSNAFEVTKKVVGFPAKGTVLLCSSGHKSPSLLLPDGSSTIFTKALLDALLQGTSHRQGYLSLRDVKDVATEMLYEMRNAPRPVVLSPDQSEGDVADVPFFPNPWIEKEQARQVEEERARKAEEEWTGLVPGLVSTNITSPMPSQQPALQYSTALPSAVSSRHFPRPSHLPFFRGRLTSKQLLWMLGYALLILLFTVPFQVEGAPWTSSNQTTFLRYYELIYALVLLPVSILLPGALFGSWRSTAVVALSTLTTFFSELLFVQSGRESIQKSPVSYIALVLMIPLGTLVIGLIYDRRHYRGFWRAAGAFSAGVATVIASITVFLSITGSPNMGLLLIILFSLSVILLFIIIMILTLIEWSIQTIADVIEKRHAAKTTRA